MKIDYLTPATKEQRVDVEDMVRILHNSNHSTKPLFIGIKLDVVMGFPTAWEALRHFKPHELSICKQRTENRYVIAPYLKIRTN